MTEIAHSRPFAHGTAHMTTIAWLAVPLARVEIAALIPCNGTHDEIGEEDTSWCGDPWPHVVRYEGQLYIEDGHHRIERRRRRGEEYVWVRLLLAKSKSDTLQEEKAA